MSLIKIKPKSPEQLLQEKQQEAKNYLSQTDWYFARKMETGQEVPEEVLSKRQEARDILN